MSDATDEAIKATTDEDDVEASGFQGWTLEAPNPNYNPHPNPHPNPNPDPNPNLNPNPNPHQAWLRSIDLDKIFSDALLHHFASGAITPRDVGKQLTIETVAVERQAGLFDLATYYSLLTTHCLLLTAYY